MMCALGGDAQSGGGSSGGCCGRERGVLSSLLEFVGGVGNGVAPDLAWRGLGLG